MTASLLPRLLIASSMLRALAWLLELTAAMPDREAADLCLHEGIIATKEALERLDRGDHENATAAAAQAFWVDMDCPEADTLRRWADEWEMMAERLGKEG